MKKMIAASVFGMFLLIGCGEEGCKNMSWEASSSLSLKSGAGNQCENISDYYDISGKDIDSYTSVFVGKVFSLNDVCFDSDFENETECPDFIPESFKFGEMTGCKFTTPPDSNADCPENAPVNLYFSCDGLLNETCIVAFFSSDDISGKFADSFLSVKDGVEFSAKRSSEKEYVATVKWETESVEGDKEEKTMVLNYLAE